MVRIAGFCPDSGKYSNYLKHTRSLTLRVYKVNHLQKKECSRETGNNVEVKAAVGSGSSPSQSGVQSHDSPQVLPDVECLEPPSC